jgi:hypothetical protein
MKRTIVGPIVIAMLAISAIATASAVAATPEYYECVKTKGGAFDKNCGAEGGGGGYARKPVKTPSSLTGSIAASVFTDFSPGEGVVLESKCGKGKLKGTIVSPTESEFVITYERCGTSGQTFTSTNEKTKGDIKTNTLIGKLVATGAAGTGIGLTVAAKVPGGRIAEFTGQFSTVLSWEGSITGEVVGDTEGISASSKDVFTVNEGGEPTIETEGSELTFITSEEAHGEIFGGGPTGEIASISLKGKKIGIS